MRSVLLLFWFISCAFGSSESGRYLRVGNPDDTAIIERPCPVYDLNCIRKFFSRHAHCTEAFGPAPDPIIRAQENLYIATANMSVTLPREEIRGINGYIDDFYINKDTNNVIFAVEFRNLNLSTGQNSRSYFQFHRRAKEPVVVTFFADVFYRSVIITAIIPNIDDMKLDEAECTTFNNDANPVLIIAPESLSDDPQVEAAMADLLSNPGLVAQQLYLTDSVYYIAQYIQYNICDFGLHIV